MTEDPVENALKAEVCSGQLTLRAARIDIARDWETTPVQPGPPPASVAPVAAAPVSHPASSAPAASSCYPRTSGGNCYRAGEYCRKADRGASGVAGNGERITCAVSGSRSRWEPA